MTKFVVRKSAEELLVPGMLNNDKPWTVLRIDEDGEDVVGLFETRREARAVANSNRSK